MSQSSAIPVIIGVGDVKNKDVNQAIEPMRLMLDAIDRALNDTSLAPEDAKELRTKIDSIGVVRQWTWPYPDLPGLIEKELGATARNKHYSSNGGHEPAKLVDDAARRLSLRQCKLAVVTGGEALASCINPF
jgi:hypothetical protein